MQTELSFLIELLLHHKLEGKSKDLIQQRIQDVEARLSSLKFHEMKHSSAVASQNPVIAMQAPSTQRIMERNPDLIQAPTAPVPVDEIAQTPVAMAALQSRQEALANAGKIEKGRDRPRKF